MGSWTTLDRVLELVSGQGARALRNVPNTLSILDTHFPRFPVLPGVLILGSVAELAAVFLREETGRGWRLAGAKGVRFCHFVQPGDQMELGVELTGLSPGLATLKGSVSVDGKLMMSVREIELVPVKTEPAP